MIKLTAIMDSTMPPVKYSPSVTSVEVAEEKPLTLRPQKMRPFSNEIYR